MGAHPMLLQLTVSGYSVITATSGTDTSPGGLVARSPCRVSFRSASVYLRYVLGMSLCLAVRVT